MNAVSQDEDQEASQAEDELELLVPFPDVPTQSNWSILEPMSKMMHSFTGLCTPKFYLVH